MYFLSVPASFLSRDCRGSPCEGAALIRSDTPGLAIGVERGLESIKYRFFAFRPQEIKLVEVPISSRVANIMATRLRCPVVCSSHPATDAGKAR